MEKAPGPLGEFGVQPWHGAARVPWHATQTWLGTGQTEPSKDEGQGAAGSPARVAVKRPCHNATGQAAGITAGQCAGAQLQVIPLHHRWKFQAVNMMYWYSGRVIKFDMKYWNRLHLFFHSPGPGEGAALSWHSLASQLHVGGGDNRRCGSHISAAVISH